MPTTPELSVEIATRHQVYLEGFKTHTYKQYEPFLVKMGKLIRSKLAGENLTEFTRKRLEKSLTSLNSDLLSIRNAYNKSEFIPAINGLAIQEGAFELKSLDQVVEFDFELPTPTQLKSAVYTNPMSAAGSEGLILAGFIESNTRSSIKKITDNIRAGVFQGLTTQQIVNNIIGTKARNFTDGQLAKDAKNMKMVVRTGLQHVSVQAREETWKQNEDIVHEVEWVSTLDSITSSQCRSLDGDRFPLNKGPRPPIHPNCRSTTVGVLDSRFAILDKGATRAAKPESGKVVKVDASKTYYSWLKGQSASFQDSVIGKSRGKLLRNGGLTVERFADLQLNNKFQPITLKEMQELEPLAFEKALGV